MPDSWASKSLVPCLHSGYFHVVFLDLRFGLPGSVSIRMDPDPKPSPDPDSAINKQKNLEKP
jgi:hypothetical protein